MDDRAGSRDSTVTFDLDVLLTTMPTPNGDVPLIFLDDPARTPAPDSDVNGEPTSALLSVCLQTGLGLITDAGDLLVPLAPGWWSAFDGTGGLTVNSPRDVAGRPFCHADHVSVPPGWADAAGRLGYVVLFAGSIAIAGHAASADAQLRAAAGSGMLAAGAVGYRPG
ncbi:hypothetical protein [Spirillospora sp. CA-294931]|uniref:hypothetical protein n=1 Tax=Spirillospora sp. CA-294931 TaxID=3240042 RepID=UPI003D90CF3C